LPFLAVRPIASIGPAEKETALGRGPAADHCRLERRPVLNDPLQLIGPGSPFGNSRETFRKSGTDGSNPLPSSRQSVSRGIPPSGIKKAAAAAACAGPARRHGGRDAQGSSASRQLPAISLSGPFPVPQCRLGDSRS
jgi:hypothetical protein